MKFQTIREKRGPQNLPGRKKQTNQPGVPEEVLVSNFSVATREAGRKEAMPLHF